LLSVTQNQSQEKAVSSLSPLTIQSIAGVKGSGSGSVNSGLDSLSMNTLPSRRSPMPSGAFAQPSASTLSSQPSLSLPPMPQNGHQQAPYPGNYSGQLSPSRGGNGGSQQQAASVSSTISALPSLSLSAGDSLSSLGSSRDGTGRPSGHSSNGFAPQGSSSHSSFAAATGSGSQSASPVPGKNDWFAFSSPAEPPPRE